MRQLQVFIKASHIRAEYARMGRPMIMDCGWGNGYVVIPKGHPYHGAHYDQFPVGAPGGLTFGHFVRDCKLWRLGTRVKPDDYIVGFDTGHAFDTLERWPRAAVLAAAEELRRDIARIGVHNRPRHARPDWVGPRRSQSAYGTRFPRLKGVRDERFTRKAPKYSSANTKHNRHWLREAGRVSRRLAQPLEQ